LGNLKEGILDDQVTKTSGCMEPLVPNVASDVKSLFVPQVINLFIAVIALAITREGTLNPKSPFHHLKSLVHPMISLSR